MMRSIIKSKSGRWILTALSLIFWIGVWWLCALHVDKAWVLPTPYEAWKALVVLLKNAEFRSACLVTLGNMFVGWFWGVLAGSLLAIVTYRCKLLEILFSPLLTVVRATPVASFIMLLWVFLMKETVPSVAVSLIVFPIVYANLFKGLCETDPKLLEVGKIHRFGFWRMAKYIYIPSVMPYFLSSLLTSLGLGWKAGVAAEVLCTPDGTVGKFLFLYKRDILTAELFACTFCIVMICFFLEKLLAALVRALAGKRGYTL